MAEKVEAGSEVTQVATCDGRPSDSKHPWFCKVIRSPAMQNFRLEIPATFVKEHGHNFQATVNLRGPSGNTEKPIRLRIQSSGQDRVHFQGVAWREFVVRNGFQVGQQLLFALVSNSTFTVLPVTNPGTPQPSETAPKTSSETAPKTSSETAPKSAPKASSETAPKSAPKASSETASKSAPKASSETGPKSGSESAWDEAKAGSCSNGRRAPDCVSETRCGKPSGYVGGKYDIVYGCRCMRFQGEVEMLVASCSTDKMQCPHFVTVMTKSHLFDNRSSAVGVPVMFLKKYGMYFAKVHRFQGPSERVLKISFCSGAKFARFAAGWTAFRRENGFKLGDVLLFSLLQPSNWVVQVVLQHRTLET